MHPYKNQLTDATFILRMLSREQFAECHSEGGDEKCLELCAVKRVRDSIKEAIIKAISQCSNVDEYQALSLKKRDSCLTQINEKGLTVRQIERLTVINRGVVQKA